jgi:hypothetical protein
LASVWQFLGTYKNPLGSNELVGVLWFSKPKKLLASLVTLSLSLLMLAVTFRKLLVSGSLVFPGGKKLYWLKGVSVPW